jgi:hypothetical protein
MVLLLQRPSDRTIAARSGLVSNLFLVRIEVSGDATLGGFPAEFLVERDDQFADTESAMTLEHGSDHVDAHEGIRFPLTTTPAAPPADGRSISVGLRCWARVKGAAA